MFLVGFCTKPVWEVRARGVPELPSCPYRPAQGLTGRNRASVNECFTCVNQEAQSLSKESSTGNEQVGVPSAHRVGTPGYFVPTDPQ